MLLPLKNRSTDNSSCNIRITSANRLKLETKLSVHVQWNKLSVFSESLVTVVRLACSNELGDKCEIVVTTYTVSLL